MVDSPSGGAPAKAPRWDLVDTEGCGGGNSFRGALGCFRGPWIYIRGRSRLVDARGAHEGGGRAHPLRARQAPAWPPRLLLDVHSKSSELRLFQKDRFRRFHSVWTPFNIPFLRNPKTSKKKSNSGLGLRLIG